MVVTLEAGGEGLVISLQQVGHDPGLLPLPPVLAHPRRVRSHIVDRPLRAELCERPHGNDRRIVVPGLEASSQDGHETKRATPINTEQGAHGLVTGIGIMLLGGHSLQHPSRRARAQRPARYEFR